MSTANRKLANLNGQIKYVQSGSIKDIKQSGIYYLFNAVTNKPDETGGLYLLAYFNDDVNVGLYISSNVTVSPIITNKLGEPAYSLQKK